MPKGKTTNASAPSTAPSSSTNPSSKDANVDLASTPKVAGSDNQPLGSTASTQPTTREKNQAPTTAPTSSPSAGSGPSQVDQLGLIQKIEELEGMQVQLSDAQRAKAEKSALAAYDSYITQLKPVCHRHSLFVPKSPLHTLLSPTLVLSSIPFIRLLLI